MFLFLCVCVQIGNQKNIKERVPVECKTYGASS